MKLYRGVRYLGHNLLGGYKFLFPLLRLKQRDIDTGNKYITPHHDICITGPPRSANTFAFYVFQLWNPGYEIAHHVHLPAQVQYAVKWNIPCIVLLRKPEDAITSLLVPDKLPVGIAILSYIWFYHRIKKVRTKVEVLKFVDAVNAPHLMILRLNSKYGTSYFSSPLTEGQRDEIFLKIRRNPNRKNELKIAIPDPNKENRKIAIKKRLGIILVFGSQ